MKIIAEADRDVLRSDRALRLGAGAKSGTMRRLLATEAARETRRPTVHGPIERTCA